MTVCPLLSFNTGCWHGLLSMARQMWHKTRPLCFGLWLPFNVRQPWHYIGVCQRVREVDRDSAPLKDGSETLRSIAIRGRGHQRKLDG